MTVPVVRGTVDPTTSDAASTPLLVLGPSIGTTAAGWTRAGTRLLGRSRVLRWDLPGHGASPATREPFTMAELAEAVVALVDAVGGGRFAYAGVSMGGAVGIELALGPAAGRLDGLAVICSDARINGPDMWLDRAERVRRQGTASLVAGSSERWFAPGFLEREPEVGGAALTGLLDVDDASYALAAEALAAYDRRADVARILVPTVVVAGHVDPVVPPRDAERLAAAIPGARFVDLPGTSHQAHIESPGALLDAIAPVLPAADRAAAGEAVRREVLGDAHVDDAAARTTPETAAFQRYITETAWGSVWTRDGLDRRTRSAITITALVCGHHWDELAMHLRAGLRNDLTRAELTEVLLNAAVYAGVPAANRAFATLRAVLEDLDAGR